MTSRPSNKLNTVQDRLRYWREKLARLSLRKLLGVVQPNLASGETVSPSTLSNYEHHIEPRASFLAALKKAYPDLNLDWLVTGVGSPTLGQTAAASSAGKVPSSQGASDPVPESLRRSLSRDLPPSALAVVGQFLSEVRPSYRNHPKAWPRFVRRFRELLVAPLRAKPHFIGRSVLADTEVTTYVVAFVAAIRPLVMVWSPSGMAEVLGDRAR